jgi:transposase
MLSQEDFRMIKARTTRGVYQKDLAAELGVHPKTISRALKRGSAPRRPPAIRPSKLDPFKPTIDRLLHAGVWNAVVIFREIQEVGYTGQLTMLRAYIRPKRTLRPSRATVRFETPPGQQLQSDWGEIVTELAGRPTKVHFIVNELAYSRRFHAWATTSHDAEHTYAGIIRSLEYFGGVPQEILVDNQKAAVLHHQSTGAVTFNPRFVDLADHYGFTPRACRPYRAQTKGKDERMVGYLKQHFFVRYRVFESWAHLNQVLEQWLREEADQRCHGTVHEVVAARFAREAPTLQPLPAHAYDTSYRETRRVAWDGYIDVRGNRYSVPATLVGQVVEVRISLDDTVRVSAADQVVAIHRLQSVQDGWVTVPEHHASLWRAAFQVEQRPLGVYEEVAQWS